MWGLASWCHRTSLKHMSVLNELKLKSKTRIKPVFLPVFFHQLKPTISSQGHQDIHHQSQFSRRNWFHTITMFLCFLVPSRSSSPGAPARHSRPLPVEKSSDPAPIRCLSVPTKVLIHTEHEIFLFHLIWPFYQINAAPPSRSARHGFLATTPTLRAPPPG